MNDVERYFLTALGSAIRGEAPPSPPPVMDWNALYALAGRHQLAGTVGGAIADLPAVPRQSCERFAQAYHKDMYLDTLCQIETDRLYGALSAHRIPYAPFKGVVIRKIYPSSVIRTMNDIDILLKPEDIENARAAMEEAGFHFQYTRSVHSIYFKEPRTWVELHSGILSHWSRYYAFYNDIWARMSASPDDPWRYEMPEEYLYLTTLLHFEKHLTNQGANVQQVLDLYTLKERLGLTSEKESIAAILRSLRLLPFAQNAEALGRAWFAGGPSTAKLDKLGQLILDGGKGGHALHAAYQRHFIKRKPTFVTPQSLLLPSREELENRYPGLRGKPKRYMLYWLLYLIQGVKHVFDRGVMAVARLWMRLSGKTDWVGLYKEAHKKRLG